MCELNAAVAVANVRVCGTYSYVNTGSCDDIKDFEAWLECEEKKRK